MTEQPIVGLGEIAKFLNVSKKKARTILARAQVPYLEAYQPTKAVLPSVLLESLVKVKGSKKTQERHV